MNSERIIEKVNKIIENAKFLGIETTSSNMFEKVEEIARQLGFKNFNLSSDLDALERALDQELEQKDEIESLDDIDSLEDEYDEELYDDSEYYDEAEFEEETDINSTESESKETTTDNKTNSENGTETSPSTKDDSYHAKGNKESDISNSNNMGRQNKIKPQNKLNADNISSAKPSKLNSTFDKLTNAQGKLNKGLHPGQALKDKAKQSVKNAGKKAGKAAAQAGKAAAKAIGTTLSALAKNPYFWLVVGITFVILIIILIIMGAASDGSGEHQGLYGYDYVEPKCTEVTVEGSGVFDIEEYVAGVVQDEVSVFLNESRWEAAKAIAVVARTFVQLNAREGCVIGNSSNTQNYATPGDAAKKVAAETEGLVITDLNGNLKLDEGYGYDAFCTNQSPDTDSLNYILCQQNQLIPKEWADKQSIDPDWKKGTMSGAHGYGMSAWGAAYLNEVQNYDYEEIIDYYFDDYEIRSIFASLKFAEEYPLDPSNELYAGKPLLTNKSMTELFEEHGLTTAVYTDFLLSRITEAGIGTREGVVAAAVTLIGSVAEMGYKLNYQWAGKYAHLGIDSRWGSQYGNGDSDLWYCPQHAEKYNTNKCYTTYKWYGLDCTGFATWALTNGLQDDNIVQNDIYGNMIPLSETEGVCQPGDVLEGPGHVMLVVAVDEENKRYIYAEATGSTLSNNAGGVKLSSASFKYLIQEEYRCSSLSALYSKY